MLMKGDKKAVQLILSRLKSGSPEKMRQENAEFMESAERVDEMRIAADDIIRSMESKDAESLKSSLMAFIEMAIDRAEAREED